NQVYPFNNTQTKHYVYAMLSTTLIDVLKANEDYRLFYFAAPSTSRLNDGVAADSYDAYIGTDPSKSIEVIKGLYNTGQFCCLNNRYITYPAGEPLIRLGYSEQNFILAEAALRGWISGDATAYYKKGIEASFQFIQAYTPDETTYHQGRKITPDAIAALLNHPNIQLTGNFAGDLEKLMIQKYVASFMQHPWDAYFDYRRTGYPLLPIDPETNRNEVKDKIPVRWMYPQVEYDYNSDNVKAAVSRQYGGVDDVNKLMWILE
ncbi:SusD/RagB family nutrient-binding outer membrane lipoprotein, partial [Parabacteroides sp. OttesenSCG-928-K15]|nr:SusD/RagB family nutrient-binding outer membrane lipoprotein [Parabacteroides sp. OttesenSCG-928-K15]